ncbi:hypothetical protein IG631_20514 [Alternaria alternata]|nr:hypothetical protein IG631_20514 [Alternaria alternata]
MAMVDLTHDSNLSNESSHDTLVQLERFWPCDLFSCTHYGRFTGSYCHFFDNADHSITKVTVHLEHVFVALKLAVIEQNVEHAIWQGSLCPPHKQHVLMIIL